MVRTVLLFCIEVVRTVLLFCSEVSGGKDSVIVLY